MQEAPLLCKATHHMVDIFLCAGASASLDEEIRIMALNALL